MGRSLEDHCADYLLGLVPGADLEGYIRDCLALWEKKYGEPFAATVKKKMEERWKDRRKA